MARLLSINVGQPRDAEWQGRIVNTAVWKVPVDGPCMVRKLNIDGDGQADRAGHGGEQRAVLVYQIDSYQFWERHLGRSDFVYGQFGENFTVEGLADAEVCIGDRYRIGGALFEVTQPRVTCYRLGIRMDVPEMAALLVSHDRPGFYLRVLEEGDVQPDDEIVKTASGEGAMTVSDISALLYKPGHPHDQLQRALRIPALSLGWRHSFEALLRQSVSGVKSTGNAGLTGVAHPDPAWDGFRQFRLVRQTFEADRVTSLELEPVDGTSLSSYLPGQFVVLRLQPRSAPVLLRSYSLSGRPDNNRFRVSIKRELQGAAGKYLSAELKQGDLVQVSAPRGSFTLIPGDRPVVLVSAGIGVTPVLGMLHALAAERSPRQVWWLYGARSRREHPFAKEVAELLQSLPHTHSYICYSAPGPADRQGVDYDAQGHLDTAALRTLDLPIDGDVYLCGPSKFMSDLTEGFAHLGVTGPSLHTETFGSASSITPGIAASPRRPPHQPQVQPDSGVLVSFARSGLNVRWNPRLHNLLELAEACDVPVRWSCRTGVCHTCETGMISGSVTYQPKPIDGPADNNVLLCCSQPAGDIVVDL
ncbi:MOSC and FAD-binding oxidoreductase domain-containing protein [Rhizobium sp. BK377]|uniref:MOSC and FAD-binding oxidoreductase domain-containing protein n=1 Tax=Rhizobium sp. BK377 TaxID=2587058 RepID=UPI0016214F55|nr:MOSC and FAD-binding oxidoreductase domain-containing protein [Rhizobium sp. BK377]MBB3465223.1 ferredoxin-NADP reductase/MOSC domain-containing protein YiiM [Rhizobium sp. BK377]